MKRLRVLEMEAVKKFDRKGYYACRTLSEARVIAALATRRPTRILRRLVAVRITPRIERRARRRAARRKGEATPPYRRITSRGVVIAKPMVFWSVVAHDHRPRGLRWGPCRLGRPCRLHR